jgi:hypothetical protein
MKDKIFVSLPGGHCFAVPVDALGANKTPLAIPLELLEKHAVTLNQFVDQVNAAAKAKPAAESDVEGQEYKGPPLCGVRG